MPIDILASVQTRGSPRIGGHQDIVSFDATVKAAERAYQAAGLTPKDIDLVELHDCFSMAEIIDSEDLGLVPRGMGAKWAAQGRTRVGGDIPINPSGGLLAKGHPVGATGVGQLYEAVLAAARDACQPGQGCPHRHDAQSRRRRHRLYGEHPEAVGCVRRTGQTLAWSRF